MNCLKTVRLLWQKRSTRACLWNGSYSQTWMLDKLPSERQECLEKKEDETRNHSFHAKELINDRDCSVSATAREMWETGEEENVFFCIISKMFVNWDDAL
jgi:hypothetical protein